MKSIKMSKRMRTSAKKSSSRRRSQAGGDGWFRVGKDGREAWVKRTASSIRSKAGKAFGSVRSASSNTLRKSMMPKYSTESNKYAEALLHPSGNLHGHRGGARPKSSKKKPSKKAKKSAKPMPRFSFF